MKIEPEWRSYSVTMPRCILRCWRITARMIGSERARSALLVLIWLIL